MCTFPSLTKNKNTHCEYNQWRLHHLINALAHRVGLCLRIRFTEILPACVSSRSLGVRGECLYIEGGGGVWEGKGVNVNGSKTNVFLQEWLS